MQVDANGTGYSCHDRQGVAQERRFIVVAGSRDKRRNDIAIPVAEGNDLIALDPLVSVEPDIVATFRLSCKRDVGAAKAFFRKAIKSQGSAPRTITLDGYAASHRAVREMKTDGQMPTDTKVRSSKYLNNLIEHDHRGAKLRISPMLGFKWFKTAAIVITGIELVRRIYKDQFNLARLPLKDRSTPAVWNAVLAA